MTALYFDPSVSSEIVSSEKQQFRYYSRRILQRPSELQYHKWRVQIAMSFVENEPLQGALADMFYGCWYEMPIQGSSILAEVAGRLPPHIRQAFDRYTKKQLYMKRISELATRWSVLVVPSFNVASHRLRTSSDDARQLATHISNILMTLQTEGATEQIEQIEAEFFSHCIACVDRIAFSLVWFRLGKHGWQFDERWARCRQYLEQLPSENGG